MNAIIEKISGSLRVKEGQCPNGHSLMSDDKKFDNERAICVQVKIGGRMGKLYFNPFYGKYEYECDIELKENDIVDVSCPDCGVSLTVETTCNLCNIPMFAIQLPDGGEVEACPKVGCHKHSLTIVDLDAQLDRMYVNETKVKM